MRSIVTDIMMSDELNDMRIEKNKSVMKKRVEIIWDVLRALFPKSV